jgi:hypothetical protein
MAIQTLALNMQEAACVIEAVGPYPKTAYIVGYFFVAVH